jgi:hypothetical protein
MIEYIYASDVRVKVKKDGQFIGTITHTAEGWEYRSKRGIFVTYPFPTLRACQKSLMPELQEAAR